MIGTTLREGRGALHWLSYRLGPGRYYQPAYRLIAAEVAAPTGCLLDVGCGPGWVSVFAAQGRPELDCVGIDLSPTMIEQARRNGRRLLNCTFREMDAAAIVYPDATFDRIVSVQSMHHWEAPDRIVDELTRVARPGGRMSLYAVDPSSEITEGWIERRGPWPPDLWIRRMWGRYSLSDAEFARMLRRVEDAGWASVRHERHGFYRCIVAER